MYKTTIVLNSLQQAKQFVQLCSEQDFNIDLSTGDRVVHAKSIIGVLSMDLSEPMEVSVKQGNEDAIALFSAKLEPFRQE